MEETIVSKIVSEAGLPVLLLLLGIVFLAKVVSVLWARLMAVMDNYAKLAETTAEAMNRQSSIIDQLRDDVRRS